MRKKYADADDLIINLVTLMVTFLTQLNGRPNPYVSDYHVAIRIVEVCHNLPFSSHRTPQIARS